MTPLIKTYMERVTRIELASKAWKACVLPLHYTRVFVVGLAGFEPASQRLPVSIFAFYLYHYNPMVDLTRLELVTFRLSGERSNRLSYFSIIGGRERIRTSERVNPVTRFRVVRLQPLGHSSTTNSTLKM